MKALFGALLCFVLATSQAYAISGGPIYSSNTSYVGSYAGVLQGAFDPTNPLSGNSIGVFSLAVPSTGNATGPFVMFARGRVFSGTVNANADPNKATLKGVLSATYSYTIQQQQTTTTTTTSGGIVTKTETVSTPVTATVTGPMDAHLETRKAARTNSAANTTIKGTATLYVEQGQVSSSGSPVVESVISLKVSGFRQSTTSSILIPTATGG